MGRFTKQVRRVAFSCPRAGLWLSARIGYWGCGWLGGRPLPSLKDLSAVLGKLEPRLARRLRRELASLEYCNRTLRHLIRNKGIRSVLPLLRVHAEPLERLLSQNTPVIVVGWHLGPSRHLMATLHTLDRKALLAVRRSALALEQFDQLEVRALDGDGLPTAFLRRAVDVLKTGGIVGMAVDGGEGARHPARFLGQPKEIGRGAAGLARITGARLMPLTARWIGHSGLWETQLHPPLPEPHVDRKQAALFEAELLNSTVNWFDDFARRNPGLIRLSAHDNPFKRQRHKP